MLANQLTLDEEDAVQEELKALEAVSATPYRGQVKIFTRHFHGIRRRCHRLKFNCHLLLRRSQCQAQRYSIPRLPLKLRSTVSNSRRIEFVFPSRRSIVLPA